MELEIIVEVKRTGVRDGPVARFQMIGEDIEKRRGGEERNYASED